MLSQSLKDEAQEEDEGDLRRPPPPRPPQPRLAWQTLRDPLQALPLGTRVWQGVDAQAL